MKFYLYPLHKKAIKTKKKRSLKKYKSKSKSIGFSQVIRIVKSFKIKRMFLNIDTGDYVLNAKLYPIFALLNHHIGEFSINFEGKNQIVLHIRNRPINLIKAFINP